MKNNLQEQIKRNIAKVDKVMKELTQEPINVLDKSVEAIIKKYYKTINRSNLPNLHAAILKHLNIKSSEDSMYFDYLTFKEFHINFLVQIEKAKQAKQQKEKGE